MDNSSYIVVESPTLSRMFDPRFVIVDASTGAVLDDAQGYGYKTVEKAHKAWGYKNSGTGKSDAGERKIKRKIRSVIKANSEVFSELEVAVFEAAKEGRVPSAGEVEAFLKERKIELPCDIQTFMKIWQGKM